jgi:hypothetical protein
MAQKRLNTAKFYDDIKTLSAGVNEATIQLLKDKRHEEARELLNKWEEFGVLAVGLRNLLDDESPMRITKGVGATTPKRGAPPAPPSARAAKKASEAKRVPEAGSNERT